MTDKEIELLSMYRDGEGRPEQIADAERLIASTPEASDWLRQVDWAEHLTTRSTFDGYSRSVDISRITGERIAAAALTGRPLFNLRRSSLFLSCVLVGLLVAVSFLFVDSTPAESPEATTQSLGFETSGSSAFAADELTREIASFVAIRLPAPVISTLKGRGTPLPAGSRNGSSQPTTNSNSIVDTLDQEEWNSEPLRLSINLHHSNSRIIIGDDQWSDTLRFDNSEDQILSLAPRLSRLTDSLNAEVARIAADTSRSAYDRAGEILIRQMEYETRIAREFELLRQIINEAEEFDGACLQDRGSTGVS